MRVHGSCYGVCIVSVYECNQFTSKYMTVWVCKLKWMCVCNPMSIPHTCVHLHVCSCFHAHMLSLPVFAQTLSLRPGWTTHITRPSDSFHRGLKQFKFHVLSFLLSLAKSSALHGFPLLKCTMWPPWKTCFNVIGYEHVSGFLVFQHMCPTKQPDMTRKVTEIQREPEGWTFSVPSQRSYRYKQRGQWHLTEWHSDQPSQWLSRKVEGLFFKFSFLSYSAGNRTQYL